MRASLLASLIAACTVAACSASPEPASPTDAAADTAPPKTGEVETFAEIDGTSEGIAFGARDGAPVLYVGSSGRLLRVQADGTYEQHAEIPGVVGIAVRADGDVLACGKGEGDLGKSDMPGVIWRVDKAGNRSLLVGPASGTSFKATNFVAVAPDDSLVFSDSGANKLYRANADGSGLALVDDTIIYPNGLAFSKDGKILYVASWSQKKVYALERNAAGSYAAPTVALDGVENVDGVTVGASGDLYLVCNGLGVLRARAGKTEVMAPGKSFKLAANGAFGVGPYGDWLYLSNLIGSSVSRLWVGEGGAPLPSR